MYINVKTPHKTHVQRLYGLIVALAALLVVFGWLAIRNARPLVCDDVTRDTNGVYVCEVTLNPLPNHQGFATQAGEGVKY